MTDMIIAALIVAVIIAFVRIFAQRNAITRLESKLDNLQQQLADVMAMVSNQNSASNPSQPALPRDITTSPSSDQPSSAFTQPIYVQPPSNQPAQSHQPTLFNPPNNNDESAVNIVTSLWGSISKWFFGENLVVRVGALVLLVGVVLLLKLASQYIQVSMPVRMALVAIGGLVMTAIGYRTTANRRNYGLTLQGVGFAIIYLTVFASFKRYGLLPPTLTFAMLAILAGLTVMFSVWQNALPLAILAFGGAFLAPILVSRPDGSVVMLFSYYLLLNIAVAVIAHYRTWKLLNALSLAVTFGLAYVWGFRQFTADSMGTSWLPVRWQLVGLLVAHMALYLFIAVRYSQQVVSYNQTLLNETNTDLSKRPILSIDSGLLFGTALLGFGLMASLLNDSPYHLAFASGALSAIYLSLGFWLLKHHRRSIADNLQAKNQFDNSFELLIEASLALGCGFLALVIPLALSAKWLSIGWAVQGAALVWLGQRTQRHWAVYIGLVLQAVSIVLLMGFDSIMADWYVLLDRLSIPHQTATAELSTTLPLTVLSAAVLLSAFILRQGLVESLGVIQPTDSQLKTNKVSSFALARVLVAIGFLLYLSAIVSIENFWQNSGKVLSVKVAIGVTLFLSIGQWLHQRFVWPSLRQVSRFILPFAMFSWTWVCSSRFDIKRIYDTTGNFNITEIHDVFGYLLAMLTCVGIAKLLGIWLISRWSKEGIRTQTDQLWWLLVLIGMMTILLQEIPFAYWQHADEMGAIISILPTVISVLVLIVIQYKSIWFQDRLSWLDTPALLKNSAWLLVPITLLWSLYANIDLDGQLLGFYFPIINPLDLMLISVLLYNAYLIFQTNANQRNLFASICALSAFLTVSSMLVRGFGSIWGTPMWVDGAWSVSIVQTGLTILWTVMATALMFLANKKAIRLLWFAGMALLTLVVAKLVLIDMSNTSAVLRVVSFIGAGLLMLVIGYLAPLPPKASQRNPKKAT